MCIRDRFQPVVVFDTVSILHPAENSVMNWVVYILIVAAAFLLMEFVAWFAHKYVMHGFLWFLHEDHHDGGYHPFQKNDAFFLIFAIPSWLSIMYGLMDQMYWPVSYTHLDVYKRQTIGRADAMP